MKTILCYGDSNTWGYIPGSAERYAPDVRWPGIMRKLLGETYNVIEEGLNGRTTVWEDPYKPGRNGLELLRPILDSHNPIDLVVLMLGTNDLKHFYGAYAADAARGVNLMIETILKSTIGHIGNVPKILLIAPPEIGDLSDLMANQFRNAAVKSKEFSSVYAELAKQHNCDFLDAAIIVKPSPNDGVHLDEDEHRKLGEAIGEQVLQMVDE